MDDLEAAIFTCDLRMLQELLAAAPEAAVASSAEAVLELLTAAPGAALLLTAAEWQAVPGGDSCLASALPAVLLRSETEAGWLVARLPESDRLRLQAAAAALRPAQRIRRSSADREGAMSSRRRSEAGPSQAQGSGDDVMILGVFMHKGGVGKTTFIGMLGAMLAKLGLTVILVDADPQGSLTSFFAESSPKLPEEPSFDEEESEEDKAAAAAAAAAAEEVDLEAMLSFGGRLVLPSLPSDRLRRTDAMSADILHGIRKWCEDKDDLLSVLKKTVRNEDFVARPTPVNVSDYEGRLMLLPGNPRLSDFAHDLERNENTTLATEFFGSFGLAMRNMAKSVGAQFVIVDLGPHNDILHKVVISSCNAVQGVLDACHYTAYSLYNMLHTDLPKWIKWFKDFAPAHSTGPYAYSQHFPRLLPFLGWGYEMKKSYVQWSSSNFFETMRQTIAGEAEEEDTDPLPPEVEALYVPVHGGGRKPPSMLVPFVKHLQYLAVAEECGRSIFDLSDKNLHNYYKSSVQELDIEKLNKEMGYVDERIRKLARNVDLLRRALAQQRQAQLEAKKGKGKKRPRDGASGSGGGGSSSGLFAPFVQQLIDAAAAAAGRPVEALVINLPGHGGSRDLPLPPPHTVKAARDDVLALLRQQLGDVQAPAALLGHSFGAKVSLSIVAQLAEQGAPLPKQVWVIDAAAGLTDPASFAMLSACLRSLEAVQQPAESLETFMRAAADAGLPESAQQYMASRCERDPADPTRFRTSFPPLLPPCWMTTAEKLHCIFGSESTILDGCPEEKARYEAAIAAKRAAGGGASTGPEPVQYWTVPEAAHFVPWTHPAELAAAIAPVLAPALQAGA
ncbi:alpha beta-hydrolase [Chlorella sorokiniana]|uniref:Alpha beta-hydrolase n=1 Tax=Chlorella sorokiniana TaxID=3076 RepID=A0A2P6U378_CHLSO|nr:alpha beta-hydrolase [Chlorella sorokiniana]|eukprot:PRW60766.1 alpha beta-hydrolase [Chlorella sorokiniana]